tara:strand:- start:7094 stop:8011 length:918 start_codon:yes stop_codon:yes gene_type:complete
MNRILKKFILIFIVLIVSCNPTGSNFSAFPDYVIPAEISTGQGMFIFPFNNFEVEIFYHVPAAYSASSKVVFALHGGSRDAESVRNSMIEKSIEYNFILIAPKFSQANFSLGDGYNLGNVYIDGDNPSDTTLNNENEWSFSLIEPLFDSVKNSLSLIEDKYNLFGFSAGAQFVHRFILFKPNARFDKVVAGAAGWYTVAENTIPFPYGFDNSILMSTNLNNLLSSDLFIQVGAFDNNPNSTGLRHNEFADAQGLNRVTRAVHFFETGQNIADYNNFNFNWSLHIIQGVGHNLIPNADNACDLMFN